MDGAATSQNDDGGFGWGPGDASSIGATSTALGVLALEGRRVRDIAGCLRFVAACHDRAGGYAEHPGGEIGIPSTAHGLVASAELDELPIFWREAGVAYFIRSVRSFEGVWLGAPVLATIRATSSAPRAWKDLALAGALADGTWGNAVATAEHVVALGLLGVEVPEREAVLASLRSATVASLEDAYRVMRALVVLEGTPGDSAAFRALIAAPTTLRETYLALSIARWIDGA